LYRLDNAVLATKKMGQRPFYARIFNGDRVIFAELVYGNHSYIVTTQTDLLRRMGELGQEYLKRLAEKIDGVIWNSPFTALASQVSSEGESMSLDVAYTSSF
jgi:hypothetical protein